MGVENRRLKQLSVILSTTIVIALLWSAFGRNYGTWTGNYCVGEPCQSSSLELGYTGRLRRKDASCPPEIVVQTSVSYGGGIFFPTERKDFLREGTCTVVVKPPR